MRYTVRTKEGSLTYGSMLEVEKAFVSGLVGPEDEVQEEGSTTWRKAGTMPLLVRAKKGTDIDLGRHGWTLLVLALSVGALYMLFNGYWIGGLILVIPLSLILTRVTYKAFRVKKP